MSFRAPLTAFMVFAFTVYAAQQPENKCDGTTYDVSVCLGAIYKQVDAELNAAYPKALKSAAQYSEKDVQKLKDSERKWIEYRDADCDAEYNLWGGGSGGPNALTLCRITFTRERTAHLKSDYRN